MNYKFCLYISPNTWWLLLRFGRNCLLVFISPVKAASLVV